MRSSKNGFFLLVAAVALAACESTGPNARGEARVFLAASAGASFSAAEGEAIVTQSGPIALSMIDSLVVDVTSVEANRGGDDSDGWQTVELLDALEGHINLLALPFEGSDSIRLALGELEVGSYDHIRLRFTENSAMLYLNQEVGMGDGTLLSAGAHAVRIPSGAQTGLKIHTARFEVAEGETARVLLLFDSPTSIGNLHTTGSGAVMMSPVLRAKE